MPILSLLLRYIPGLIYTALTARFVLMIFYPGTQETKPIFNALRPLWNSLQQLTDLLTLPLTLLAKLLTPFLPENLHAWFPVSPAPVFMHHFSQLLLKVPLLANSPLKESLSTTHYEAHYPGEFQWLILMSLPLWYLLFTLVDLLWVSWQEAQEIQKEEHKKRNLQQTKLAATSPLAKDRNKDLAMLELMRGLKQENVTLQAQKIELKSTISQYISPRVLQYLEQNKQSFESISNQKQQVSILFCDIRGFTAFTQSHTPEEVSQYLENYFNLVNDVILNQCDGVINKLMGDAVMAYWGFPVPNADHAYVATQAGVRILKAIEQWNQTPGNPPLHVGIGICTGEVMIGNVGSRDFKDFTLIGDPVNLASRVEGLNKELGSSILIDTVTFQGLRNRMRCKNRGLVDIRGWQGQLQIFEPTG